MRYQKTTQKHLDIFKKECQLWIDRFELNHFRIFYDHCQVKDCYARINHDVSNSVATIEFNKEWAMAGVDNLEESIKETAKHEIIHLLLAKLSTYGISKHYTKSDCIETEEELVRKLEKIIN